LSYINNILVRELAAQYELRNGSYETLASNSRIRKICIQTSNNSRSNITMDKVYVMNLKLGLSQKNSFWIGLITRKLNGVSKYNVFTLYTLGS